MLSTKTVQDLKATAHQFNLVDGDALDLRVQYPEVWSALSKFDSDAWDSVTRIIDITEHERTLRYS